MYTVSRPERPLTPKELLEAASKKQPHMKLAQVNEQEAFDMAMSIIIGQAPDTVPSDGLMQTRIAQDLLNILFPEKPGFQSDKQYLRALDWATRTDLKPETSIFLHKSILERLQQKDTAQYANVVAEHSVSDTYKAWEKRFASMIFGI